MRALRPIVITQLLITSPLVFASLAAFFFGLAALLSIFSWPINIGMMKTTFFFLAPVSLFVNLWIAILSDEELITHHRRKYVAVILGLLAGCVLVGAFAGTKLVWAKVYWIGLLVIGIYQVCRILHTLKTQRSPSL